MSRSEYHLYVNELYKQSEAENKVFVHPVDINDKAVLRTNNAEYMFLMKNNAILSAIQFNLIKNRNDKRISYDFVYYDEERNKKAL